MLLIDNKVVDRLYGKKPPNKMDSLSRTLSTL